MTVATEEAINLSQDLSGLGGSAGPGGLAGRWRASRSEDGATWEAIEVRALRRKLSNWFKDVDLAIKVMADDGETIRTPYALYRRKPTP